MKGTLDTFLHRRRIRVARAVFRSLTPLETRTLFAYYKIKGYGDANINLKGCLMSSTCTKKPDKAEAWLEDCVVLSPHRG